MIFCIDSHTFIWAIKKQADDHDRHRLIEAEKFLQWVKSGKHQLILPTIVLAECLIRADINDHHNIMLEAYRTCMVVNYDERCALKYGELLRLEKWEIAKLEAQKNGIRREKMKIDHMILSCALINAANGIFTEDEGLIKFASPHIKVFSLPKIGEQIEMFNHVKAT